MPLRRGASEAIVAAARAFTHQVWTEPFRSFPSLAWPWSLILGVVFAGGILLRWHPPGAFTLALLGAVCFVGQAFGGIQVGWLFARTQGENVIAVLPSRGTVRHRVLLVVDYDTPGWRPFDRGGPWIGGAWGFPLVLTVMTTGLPVVAALQLLHPRPLWAWVAMAPALASLLGIIVTWCRELNAKRHRESTGPGPEVTLAIRAGETLANQPLDHTEVWLVFTGCGYLGQVGLRAFLDRHRRLLEGADFLLAGGGGVQQLSAGAIFRGCPSMTQQRAVPDGSGPNDGAGLADVSRWIYNLAASADTQPEGK